MIRGILNRACCIAERILAAVPEPREIRRVALRLYGELGRSDRGNMDTGVDRDLAIASARLAALRWIDSPQTAEEDVEAPDPLLDPARKWRLGLSPAGVLDKGRFAAGSGNFVGVLDRHGADEERAFAKAQAERILRHVEVRRALALSNPIPHLSRERLLIEKLDVAILFSRLARRNGDLRFLNTALKMNDWLLEDFSRRTRGSGLQQRAHLLLSLVEQECAVKVLL